MRLINLGILAHVDAGKTTITEQLLYYSGALQAPGSVDQGNTQSDHLSVERARGISVAASAMTITVENLQINLIDTPGHMDFTGEVERALSALDAVILVISALEGVQAQTELFWAIINELRLPTLLFVNKIDRAGFDPNLLIAEIQEMLTTQFICLNRPRNPGESSCSVVPKTLNETDLLILCEEDEALADAYLEGKQINAEEIYAHLQKQAGEAKVFPLLFGSAISGIGISDLLEAISVYLPAAPVSPADPLSGIIYKVEHDKSMGKIAHVRLFSGEIRNRDAVELLRSTQPPIQEKVTQIRKLVGAKRKDAGIVQGGEIAALYGLTQAKAGDRIGDLSDKTIPKLAAPLFRVKAFAGADAERELLRAVMELCDEDPTLAYEWNLETRELVLHVMGKIQLEILSCLLLERYGLTVQFSAPSVIYRETPINEGIGLEVYTMPKPCWAVVKLLIEPRPAGSGYQYVSQIKDNQLFYRYQAHIETAVPETLQQGLMGWQVVDLKVSLIGGEHHIMHTHPLDFFLAAPIAVMKALEACQTKLLEPVINVRFQAPEDCASKLIGDILEMRGSFDSPVMRNGKVTTEALLPVATSIDYAARFASLTSGHGIIKQSFHGYQDCPEGCGETRPRIGVNPLDRARWILYKRNALTQSD